MKCLFANTALTAVLRAVLAILTVLAGFAGIGARAGRGENVELYLIEEKDRQNNLRKDDKES